MRIFFDYQVFLDQSYGGISRYYTSLADQLINQGQNVNILAEIHINNYLRELPFGVVKGYKISNYPPKSGRIIQFFNHTINQFQIKVSKPDIIHETYYSALPTVKTSAIRVTSVYDMIHELFNSQFSSNDRTTQSKKKTFDRVDHIISISNSTKKDLVELFRVDESKISVVHLGVDLRAFQKPKVDNRFKNIPYILYVGSRSGYKNFIEFIRACSISKKIKNKVKIVAFGGGTFNKIEMEMIIRFGFNEGFVEQVGGNDEMLASLYANALCFVYPSKYEGFGLPPLEAMASGCPVVTSNTSSMPEVINRAGIYFDPNNTEEMSNAIESVIENDSLRSQLIELGDENIKLFSWQKCANDTLSIYKKLTGKE
jgi:glycosyltransferase involved in cell wall biosynthesis